MRRHLLIIPSFLATLALSAGVAQAVVVDLNPAAAGPQPVQYNAASRGDYYGVALIPGTRTPPYSSAGVLSAANIPTVNSGAPCIDPALTSDLALSSGALCYHGGPVLHRNETFALTWDPLRRYWSGTRDYIEQYLRDVADGTGTLTSPFAVTTQYTASNGRALNESKYGGGCIDYGNPNHMSNQNTTCLFGSSVQTGPGYNYPTSGCKASGASFTGAGGTGFTPNDVCLTDAQIRAELTTIVKQMGIISRTQPGYQPMVVLPLPPNVEACLGAQSNLDGRLCSVNSTLTPPAPKVNITEDPNSKLPTGTYNFELTYQMATQTGSVESAPGEAFTVKLTKPSDITISAPTQVPGTTGWNLYATTPGGTPYYQQQSDLPFNSPDVPFLGTDTAGPQPPAPDLFCSYHSQLNIDGTNVAYVVQPWSAMTQCDEPDAPPIPPNPPPAVLSQGVGLRLVSPLSQSEIAAIIDPQLDGWFAQDGSEINDNDEINNPPGSPYDVYNQPGCVPLGNGLDKVVVGRSSQNPYLLQREWNNGANLESDPFTFGCAPAVILTPSVVVPSPIDQGEMVGFDGSATSSTLVIPNASYTWSFGDGTTGSGASVVHSFGKSGFYKVTLRVTDRGGNTRSLTQTVEVLGPDGQPPSTGGNTGGNGGTPGGGNTGGGQPTKLKVSLQLLPQSLRSVLRNGLSVRVTSNLAANGFATLSIFRSAAHRAHLASARHPNSLMVIGRGTVSGLKNGTVRLSVRVSPATARKLAHAGHLTLTLHMALYAKNGSRTSAAAVGRY